MLPCQGENEREFVKVGPHGLTPVAPKTPDSK